MNFSLHSFKRATKPRHLALEFMQAVASGASLALAGSVFGKVSQSLNGINDAILSVSIGTSSATAIAALAGYSFLRLNGFENDGPPNKAGQRTGTIFGIAFPLALTAVIYPSVAKAEAAKTEQQPPATAMYQAPSEDLTLPQLLCRITNPTPRGCEHAPKKSSSQELKTLPF